MAPQEPDIPAIVRESKRLAVVGWSENPERASHDVATYLHERGYEIIPVNPVYAGKEAYGTTVRESLDALADEAVDVDAVVVFRRSEDVPDHVDGALALGAPVFWMQLGIRNEEVAQRLRKEGVSVVQDHCFKVEHGRHVGS